MEAMYNATPLVSGVFAQEMLPIIEADKTRNVVKITQAVLECMNNNSNISIQMIETELRRNNCFSYFIAKKRPEWMKVVNNSPYYLHISGQSDQSSDSLLVKTNRAWYDKNLLNLSEANFIENTHSIVWIAT